MHQIIQANAELTKAIELKEAQQKEVAEHQASVSALQAAEWKRLDAKKNELADREKAVAYIEDIDRAIKDNREAAQVNKDTKLDIDKERTAFIAARDTANAEIIASRNANKDKEAELDKWAFDLEAKEKKLAEDRKAMKEQLKAEILKRI